MSDDFPTPDEIINGTYKSKSDRPKPPEPPMQMTHLKLDADQVKAIQLISSGLAYVVVAVKPTYDDPDDRTVATGSDFFTVGGGPPEILRAAAPHLPGVLERLWGRMGLL